MQAALLVKLEAIIQMMELLYVHPAHLEPQQSNKEQFPMLSVKKAPLIASYTPLSQVLVYLQMIGCQLEIEWIG